MDNVPKWFPSAERVIRQLAILRDTARTLNDPKLGPVDPDFTMDVRLQVTPYAWEVHYGDASYDTDHHGWWGAASLDGSEGPEDLAAVAAELIDQAADAWAQEG